MVAEMRTGGSGGQIGSVLVSLLGRALRLAGILGAMAQARQFRCGAVEHQAVHAPPSDVFDFGTFAVVREVHPVSAIPSATDPGCPFEDAGLFDGPRKMLR